MRIALLLVSILMFTPAAEAQKGKCPADIQRASFSIWPMGSVRTGTTVTGTHACGRRMQCSGGALPNSSRGITAAPRACRWL